jgi:hypothetical protein
MANTDMLVNNWNTEDDALVPKPTQPIAPGVAEAAANVGDRWGADTPMFDSPADMHGFLQGIGMAPGGFPADVLDSMLYMSEGQFADAIVSMGAAVPVLGNLAPMRYGGKVQRGKRFKKELQKRFDEYEIEQANQMQTNKELLDVRNTQRMFDEIDTKVGLEKQRRLVTESGDTYTLTKGQPLSAREKKLIRMNEDNERSRRMYEEQWKKNQPKFDPGDFDLDR